MGKICRRRAAGPGSWRHEKTRLLTDAVLLCDTGRNREKNKLRGGGEREKTTEAGKERETVIYRWQYVHLPGMARRDGGNELRKNNASEKVLRSPRPREGHGALTAVQTIIAKRFQLDDDL